MIYFFSVCEEHLFKDERSSEARCDCHFTDKGKNELFFSGCMAKHEHKAKQVTACLHAAGPASM